MNGLSIFWGLVALTVLAAVMIWAAKKRGRMVAVGVVIVGGAAIWGAATVFGEERCTTERPTPVYDAPTGEPAGELARNTRITVVERLPSGWISIDWKKDSEKGSGYPQRDDFRFNCS